MKDIFDIPADINQNKIIISPIEGPIRLSVGLYVGLGAGEEGKTNVQRNLRETLAVEPVELTGEDISEKDLSVFNVIIFPGGRAGKQAEDLGEIGKKKIKEFVENGGGYLGICAGMYLATVGFDWSLHILNAETKVAKDEWRRGKGFVDIELTEEGKVILGKVEGIFKCRYSNGPLIQSSNIQSIPSFVTAAYFRSEISDNGTPQGIMVNTPAACFSTYGKGKVFAISVHPENTPGLEGFLSRVLYWLAGSK